MGCLFFRHLFLFQYFISARFSDEDEIWCGMFYGFYWAPHTPPPPPSLFCSSYDAFLSSSSPAPHSPNCDSWIYFCFALTCFQRLSSPFSSFKNPPPLVLLRILLKGRTHVYLFNKIHFSEIVVCTLCLAFSSTCPFFNRSYKTTVI